MTWRVGNSWGSKPNAVLVTIVQEGTGAPDPDGRRDDDVLVGCASPVYAERIVNSVNAMEALEAVFGDRLGPW